MLKEKAYLEKKSDHLTNAIPKLEASLTSWARFFFFYYDEPRKETLH